MKYTEIDCTKILEKEEVSIDKFCLIDTYSGTENYSISFIRDGILYDCLISDDKLMFACIDFLIKNGNKVYQSISEFKNENPDILC